LSDEKLCMGCTPPVMQPEAAGPDEYGGRQRTGTVKDDQVRYICGQRQATGDLRDGVIRHGERAVPGAHREAVWHGIVDRKCRIAVSQHGVTGDIGFYDAGDGYGATQAVPENIDADTAGANEEEGMPAVVHVGQGRGLVVKAAER
jgi:hypothetical protein